MQIKKYTSKDLTRSKTASIALILACGLFALAVSDAAAHEFEDGFVERSVAVIIRDDVARMQYSIGLNPNTRLQLIEFWRSQTVDSGSLWRQEQTPPASPVAPNNPSDPNDPDSFLRVAGSNVSSRLMVLVDGQLIPVKFVSACASSRHHVDVTVTVEFRMPLEHANVPVSLEIIDGNFFPAAAAAAPVEPVTSKSVLPAKELKIKPDEESGSTPAPVAAPFGGGFRYALKATGAAVLSRSNVASILIRADRQLDANLSMAQIGNAFKIEAEVVRID